MIWNQPSLLTIYNFIKILPMWYLYNSTNAPDDSAGKESAYNAGDPSLFHGSGRSPGEGISYPLWYSWASLGAQMVKKMPTMLETSVGSLGWEDPLEKGMATHSNILAWRIPMDQGAWQATVHGVSKSQTWLKRLSTRVWHHHDLTPNCHRPVLWFVQGNQRWLLLTLLWS